MLSCFAVTRAAAGSVVDFDDIKFWVGTGANRAALVLDWDGTSTVDNALAWGYRFDGTPKAFDMLHAIVAADARLYAKIGPVGWLGYGVFGLGYDVNHDGQFALDDETFFDEQGFAITDPADGAVSVNPEDYYGEGWDVTGIWQYGVATGNPFTGGDWAWSGAGISSRNVLNDSWHSLAFSTNFSPHSFSRNPLAAEVAGNADFDGDGDIDGRDFLAWQRGESPDPLSSTDLARWQASYSVVSLPPFLPPPFALNFVVPEPSTGLLLLSVVLLRLRITHRRRIVS
jgi:hypothetical protein